MFFLLVFTVRNKIDIQNLDLVDKVFLIYQRLSHRAYIGLTL